MKSLKRQRGLSLLGVGLLVFLIVFFGLLIVKMSGTYMDHFTINQMIQTSLEGQSASRFSQSDFQDRLKKNMEINQISINLKEAMKINTRQSPATIVLDYEKRVHLFANVDVVMTFYEEYEL
jgi:polyhydroxyalkanoate synthesis regulator protein